MNRKDLEHIIRAAGEIAGVQKVIILGSQAILAQFPHLSEPFPEIDNSEISLMIQHRETLIRSVEADLMIPDSADKTEMVEGAIGELSSFHDTFGYYAQGVDLTTSRLPEGWENRLVEICNENTNGISGLCLEIHDLIISKLYAGRKKDIDFFKAALDIGLLSRETLAERLSKTLMTDKYRDMIKDYINKGFAQ